MSLPGRSMKESAAPDGVPWGKLRHPRFRLPPVRLRHRKAGSVRALVPFLAAVVAACGGGGGTATVAPPVPDTRTACSARPTASLVVWANEGGDKVAREEQRATRNPASVLNRRWDGTGVKLFGAANETVSFNLVLEAGENIAAASVEIDALAGPDGASISSRPATGDGVFDTTGRDIEVFLVRYLPIEGLSLLSYDSYDERHVPRRLRRPWSGEGIGQGRWTERPDHDRHYPDIAVPIEWQPRFDIAAGQSQSVWVDVTIPRDARAGRYSGFARVRLDGETVKCIPVDLDVRRFALPDVPAAKTMVVLGQADVAERYTGKRWPDPGSPEAATARLVRDRHFQMAHRHRLSLIDGDAGQDQPSAEWLPRLNGSLFTRAKGYSGPGEGVGNGVYSIGTYGSWGWKSGGEAAMRAHADAWETWFAANSPATERFLYLIDESTDYAQTEQWAAWLKNHPGPGRSLKSFATIPLPDAVSKVPSLDIAASWFAVADPAVWRPALANHLAKPGRAFFMYNGKRPATGSFALEDDGIALRQLAWAQYKMKVDRWFYWESTYYNDYQSGRGQTNVFRTAQTFGSLAGFDEIRGKTGWNYSNGDGVLFYPGTDRLFPAESYGRLGPIASLRLKLWRRGIQDVDYLVLAAKVDPARTAAIVQRMVPKALWEYGVSDPADPTWVRSDIAWSTDPDDWEAARAELADIIEGR